MISTTVNMNELQRKAFDENIASLVDALEHNKDKFLTDLRMARVINNDQMDTWRNLTTRQMLINLLEFLKNTDNGWGLTIQHFKKNDQASLAEKLTSATARKPPTAQPMADNKHFFWDPKLSDVNILSDLQTQRKTGSQKNDEIIKQLKSLKLEAEAYHSKWNADYLVANFCKVTGIGIIFVCAMIIAPMTLESSSDFVGALAAFGFGSAAGIATVLSGVYFSNEADKRFGHVTRNVVAKIKELICRISTEFSDLGTKTEAKGQVSLTAVSLAINGWTKTAPTINEISALIERLKNENT